MQTNNFTSYLLADVPLSFVGKRVLIENENMKITGELLEGSAKYFWNSNSVEREFKIYTGATLINLKHLPEDTTITLVKDDERSDS